MSEGVEFRSGFVALVGRPNVGKSTLLNALLKEKLSIVTPKPQTTRQRVIGVLQLPAGQIALVDTPGIHAGQKRALNRSMNRAAGAALADADLVVQVIEALRWTEEDELVLRRLRTAAQPAIAVISKVDKVKPRGRLLPFMSDIAGHHPWLELVPVSAERGQNLERLVELLLAHLPAGERMFPVEQRTDRSERFRIAECIREKLTLELQEELPYGIAVELESLQPTDDGRTEVSAVIWVDRAGQKPIVIGAGGARLKRIGQRARLELNRVLGGRFHLNLWVKVRADWADDARALAQLGLE